MNMKERYPDIDWPAIEKRALERRSKYKPIFHPELRIAERTEDGFSAFWGDLGMIVSIAVEDDGKSWLHASVSRRDKTLPTYEDLGHCKRLCIGDHRTAIQVFPPKSDHVNLAEVLHLWCCLDGDVTPDFTGGFGTI